MKDIQSISCSPILPAPFVEEYHVNVQTPGSIERLNEFIKKQSSS
jgi:hypothetical protein